VYIKKLTIVFFNKHVAAERAKILGIIASVGRVFFSNLIQTSKVAPLNYENLMGEWTNSHLKNRMVQNSTKRTLEVTIESSLFFHPCTTSTCKFFSYLEDLVPWYGM
jgi:hypothetical protein